MAFSYVLFNVERPAPVLSEWGGWVALCTVSADVSNESSR